MNKQQLAVIQGFVVAIIVFGVSTIIWAAFIHLFPNLWGWVKTFGSFINYSFALYLGVLSASLRTKAMGINAPLYVMLLFFFLNILLRLIFVSETMQFTLVLLKLIYSVFLLAIAFKNAQLLQHSYPSRRYGRLK